MVDTFIVSWFKHVVHGMGVGKQVAGKPVTAKKPIPHEDGKENDSHSLNLFFFFNTKR